MTGPLAGVKVVEVATVIAGPLAGAFLGDFGADVIKIEHPAVPDTGRGHGPGGLWGRVLQRNKRCGTLNLSTPEGADLLRRLLAGADVLIENFRPGTLERWGLGPDVLHEVNPGLVIARITGFGQTGPYASRPGFGTLAEAMSGFAMATGEPDGPPTLPPFGLADSVTGLATAYAVLLALRSRDATGRGQVVDLSLVEPLMAMLGPQVTWWRELGYVSPRLGNRSANNAPRNAYRCADGRWVAVSTSATSVAARVMTLVGLPSVVDEPWFATGAGRATHADLLDGAVAAWIAERDRDEVIRAFTAADAAIGPVYAVPELADDPHLAALGTFVTVPSADGPDLTMQNVPFRLSETPGGVREAGRPHGHDTDEILRELGLADDEIAALRERGVA
ncbi:CaiB/BaiF CoA transferase family protein [Hamadaea tsunoensis]|uniref:CaiB/BaiF CoA transferase family protein n=1 Tax=Hamadaea tsunoensis TaxID=53368 RepID=UPI00041A97E2|nr:CaiB/BaiF CoA-transferase family protein [Hamadaea tsunoensis]